MYHLRSVLVIIVGTLGVLCVTGCGSSGADAGAVDIIKGEVGLPRTRLKPDSVQLGSWTRQKNASDDNHITTHWKATTTFPEPYGYAVMVVDGHPIIHIAFDKGSTLDFSGEIDADKSGDYWHYTVAGSPLESRLQSLGMPATIWVFKGSDSSIEPGGGRADSLIALTTLNEAVAENSDEGKKLVASVAERQMKLNDEIAVNQQKSEKEAAERQQAALEQKQKHVEERHEKAVGPWLEPFKSKSGVVIAGRAGNALGWLITDAQVDEQAGKVTGKGICLRQMPFRPFTFEATCDSHDRSLAMTTSLSGDPLTFYRVNSSGGLVGNDDLVLSALDVSARSNLDTLATIGGQLGSAQPLNMTAQVQDGATAKSRQGELQTLPWTGIVSFHDKKSADFAGLFSENIQSKKVFHWHASPIGIRLDPPVQAQAIYIKGGTAESSGLTVVINGVHVVKIDAIPKNGAVLCPLPADIKLMDLRFEPAANAQSTGIFLLK